MSAQTPITYDAAFAHAEKLMNDGCTLAEIKKMLEIKARVLTDEIRNAQTMIDRVEAEKQALRKVYAHILGIERNAAATNIDGLITNRARVAASQTDWPQPFVPTDEIEMRQMEVAHEIVQTLRENTPPAAETVAVSAAGRKTHVPDGTYTVVMANERRTIKIKQHWDEAEKAKGTRVACYMSGSDNERDFTGFAFVKPNGQFIIWKKFRNGSALLQSALAFLLQGDNHAEAGMTYAMESGNCWKCGRKLTVPASLNRGVGPECAKKLGL